MNPLAAEEEAMQPQPGEDQHDESDGEAEDEPRAEVDHLRVGVPPGTTHLFQNPSNLFSHVRIMTFSRKKSTLSPTARVLTGGEKSALSVLSRYTLSRVCIN